MKKLFLCFAFACSLLGVNAQNKEMSDAQKATLDKLNSNPEGWKRGGSIGADFTQLLLINPRSGAGQNKLGLTAIGGYSATYKKGRLVWDNAIGETFGIQKLGRGERPILKSVDELKAFSNIGYQLSEGSKWYYMIEGTFRSQLTPTYSDGINNNLLKFSRDTTWSDSLYLIKKSNKVQSKFLAPGYLTIAPGMNYRPNDNFDVLISPATFKWIFVMDDNLASREVDKVLHRGAFGNDIRSATDYDKIELQIGASLRAKYKTKCLNDKLSFATNLFLFMNYKTPTQIDVEWTTETGYTLFKGLQIGLNTALYYDHDLLVNLDRDNNLATGIDGYESTGRRVQFVEAMFIKYGFTF